MIVAALVLVLIGSLGFVARAVKGPTLADRIVALDGVVISLVGASLLSAMRGDSTWFLDLALAVSFIGFAGATAAARFVERRGG